MNIRMIDGRCTALLAIGALVMGTLLGATAAQAATVEKIGDTATAIRGLTIGSVTYDVEFTCNMTTKNHWGNPPVFDFTTPETALAARNAIVAALNADGGVLAVGCGTGTGEFTPYIFRLAFRLEEITIPLPLFLDEITVKFLFVWEGVTGDTSSPGLWAGPGETPEDFDQFPWGDDSVSPVFTQVGSGGPGNSPPVAEAGGPYEGTTGVTVNFDGSDSSDQDGNIVSWDWNFGDGDSGSGETPSHTYATANRYNVSLTVTDDAGDTSSDSSTADIGDSSDPPIADAGGSYSGTVGAPVRFDGTGSRDPDGNIATYAWDFGDGGNANGPTPNHTYDGTGPYAATLTVTDDSGETDFDTANVSIGLGNLPPNADAGGPYIGAAGVAKSFDGTASSDLDGSIVSYLWNFGDGNMGSGPTPSHTYADGGSYSVSLTVTDDAGATDGASTTAIIGEPNPDPDDRLVDVVTLGNVGGGDAADLAVLDVALVNSDQLSATVHVYDGGTGNEIYQVDVSDSWRSLSIETALGTGGQLLAILQRNDSADLRVRLLNAADGTLFGDVAYFDDSWTPIDIISVRDAGGPNIAGIGVLAENPAGQQAIEVHTVDDGALVNQALYFNDVWKASAAVDLGEFNGNGRSEVSVLATNNAGKHAVETRDILSGKQISRHFFLGPTNTMIGLADSADVDGNGKPEVIVLGNKDAADSTANTAQTKDVKTGVLISKPGSFGPDFTGFALRGMDDVDGSSSPGMVIGALNDVDNTTRVQVRDVASGSLMLNTGVLSPAFDPRDLELLDDVSGNTIQELVAAGLDSSDLSIRVQVRDGQSGALLLNIDIN